MSKPFSGSGRFREGGFAATHLQDFKSHYTGSGYRHGADQLDMNPPISVFNNKLSAPTVQETLQKMANLIDTVGQGFITIGDGYDIGDYTVDSGTTIQQAFLDAFANPRLVNGGIVLVKAGTYHLTQTVDVPAGITIMGEIGGTYIFGSTNEQPMFRCAKSIKLFEVGNILSSRLTATDTTDTIMFWNITLGDNLDGYKVDGLGNVMCTMSTVPMIQISHGSNVILDRVTMIGRLTNSFPPLTLTLRAVGMDNTTSAPNFPTSLVVKNCYIDSVSQGIHFPVRNGALDHLRVESCKVRNYGGSSTEDSSLVSFNFCNAHIESNTQLVGGLGAEAGFYIRNDSVADTKNTRIAIVNNTYDSSNVNLTTSDANNFFINASTYTIPGVVTGNSCGVNYNNPWFLTVGDGTNSVGDITGPSAIDTAIAATKITASLGSHIDIIAVVGYGTYTVTAGGTDGKLNLIGKSRHGALPTVQLNSSTGTDEAGNKTTAFGSHLENIYFTTSGATYNTVRLNGGQFTTGSLDKIFTVKNCKFLDAGLIAEAPSRSSGTEFISYTLESCKFSQSGSFADNFCFLLPQTADHVYLRDVFVHDKGYVGGIGDVSGVYTSSTPVEGVVTIENCIFNQDYSINGSATNAITAASPLTGMNNYFFVNCSRARVLIQNTTISCADANSTVAATGVIGGGMPAAGTFKRYISLQARDVILKNSLVVAPDQRYTTGGVNYSIIGVWVEPTHTLEVNGCKLKGSCALQLSGTGQFTDIVESSGIFISDSELKGFQGAGSTSTTALDIDAKVFTAGSERIFPKIAITNCHIDNKNDSSNTNAQVQHAINTGVDYDVIGTAQIFAQGWAVKVSNCSFDGKLGTNLPSGFTSLAGLYIDTLGSLTATLSDAFVMVSNNTIKFECDLNTGSASNTATVGWFEGVRLHIDNNAFHYRVTTTGGTNKRGYATLRTVGTQDDGSIIANNTFGRSSTGNLNVAAISILSLSGQGAIIDNDFDQPTLDGSSTALFSDAVSPVWRKERNRNQTDTLAITSNTGVQSIGGTSLGFTGANNDFNPSVASTGHMDYVVQTAGSGAQAVWAIDLTSVLPPNVYVISATTDLSFTGGTAGGNHFLELQSATQNDSSGASTPPGGTVTVTATSPTTNYRVTSSSHPIVFFFYNTTAAGSAVTATITPIVVTFRW